MPNEFSDSFFDVFIRADRNGDGEFETEVFNQGIEGAVGFGFSPLDAPNSGNAPHMLVELEVPLLITAAQAEDGIFAGGVSGPDGGGYSPDPLFRPTPSVIGEHP